jgi:hypothetical protein
MLLAILLPVQAMMGEQQDHGRFPGQKGDKEDATRVRFIRPQLTAVNDAFTLAQGKRRCRLMSRSTARLAKLRSKFPEDPTEHHAAMQLGSFEKAAARSQALGD